MACKVSPWAPCRRQRRMPQSSLTWRRPATRPCSKRSLAAVRIDLLHDLSSVMCRDRHDLGLAVALDRSKHGHLAGSAPAAFAFPGAAKRRFIKFQHPLERPLPLPPPRAATAPPPVAPPPSPARVPPPPPRRTPP